MMGGNMHPSRLAFRAYDAGLVPAMVWRWEQVRQAPTAAAAWSVLAERGIHLNRGPPGGGAGGRPRWGSWASSQPPGL